MNSAGFRKPLYIFLPGRLRRKQNTLFYETDEKQVAIPIETTSEVHIFGETHLNSKIVTFLSKHRIPVHFYDYYGNYCSTLYPRERNISGMVVIQQSAHFLDTEKRLFLAKRFVEGACHNLLYVIRYYKNRGKSLQTIFNQIEEVGEQMRKATSIEELRGYEGKIRDLYYSCWDELISVGAPFTFTKRERRPPSNPVNALISFGNALLYSVLVSEIYHVHLHGGISYLHEPASYRFSLALDLADIFKPIFVDRLILKLINRKEIQATHFEKASNYAYLNEKGRRLYVEQWQQVMERTVKHPTLKRNVSYRRLLRLECYKLIKHFLGEKVYQPFKIWW
jgi:CRISPR-associated protein Cas1